MPSRRGSSPAGVKVVRRTLADGTVKEYRYAKGPRAPKAPRYPADSLDALLAAFRRSPELAAKAVATRATYAVYLRDLDGLGGVQASALTRRELLEVRDAIAVARGTGAATGFQRTASAVFAWAVDRGWLPHNPLARARMLPGGHLAAWTESDAATALEALPEPFRRVVALGMHTGQRRGDLIAMSWGAYDGATIRLRQQKTGTALVIPCHPDLRAELDRWKQDRTAAVILTSPQGRPWTAAHLTREMTRRLRGLGLPEITVHGLRKLAAARLAEAGCSALEIAAITGHQSLSMVQLYTRSADQQRLAEAAVERLENARARKHGKRAVED
jgi:integrase